jgi:hypothetical protein
MKRPARVPSQLSESLHKRLNAYALAASAAGVGVLAMAQPAEARIVYTKTHKPILGQGQGPLMLDLNHDGITDFLFIRKSSAHYSTSLKVGAYSTANRIWGSQGKGVKLASALPTRFRIAKSKHFSLGFHSGSHAKFMWWAFQSCTSTGLGTHCVTDSTGQWKPPIDRYLGLKFQIKGKTHYGWARISSGTHNPFILTGYAYETIPNKPIITGKTHGNDVEHPNSADPGPGASLTSPVPDTPQPASLGALAMGARGLSIWRRKEWTL